VRAIIESPALLERWLSYVSWRVNSLRQSGVISELQTDGRESERSFLSLLFSTTTIYHKNASFDITGPFIFTLIIDVKTGKI
jgi:hypothetical protein